MMERFVCKLELDALGVFPPPHRPVHATSSSGLALDLPSPTFLAFLSYLSSAR